MTTRDAFWSKQEVTLQAEQVRGQLDVWDALDETYKPSYRDVTCDPDTCDRLATNGRTYTPCQGCPR